MNIVTLKSLLDSAISSNGAINTWSMVTYGVNHTILERADERNAPTQDTCPCCVLTPIRKSMSQQERNINHDFQVDLIIYDTSSAGFANLEAYRLLIQDTFTTAISTMNLNIVDIVCDYDSQTTFPFLWCGMQLRFLEQICIGTNPLS